jgi:hypothetical protein
LADYFTKHHPAKHHQLMRPQYLHVTNKEEKDVKTAFASALLVLQGCVETCINVGQTRIHMEYTQVQNQHAQAERTFAQTAIQIQTGNQTANLSSIVRADAHS